MFSSLHTFTPASPHTLIHTTVSTHLDRPRLHTLLNRVCTPACTRTKRAPIAALHRRVPHPRNGRPSASRSHTPASSYLARPRPESYSRVFIPCSPASAQFARPRLHTFTPSSPMAVGVLRLQSARCTRAMEHRRMAPDSDSSPCETTPIDFLLRRSPSLIHHADLWYQLGRNGTRTISPPVRSVRHASTPWPLVPCAENR